MQTQMAEFFCLVFGSKFSVNKKFSKTKTFSTTIRNKFSATGVKIT